MPDKCITVSANQDVRGSIMEEISSGIASLKISGKPFVLAPEQMTFDGSKYSVKEAGAEFTLEIKEFDNAFTSLLRITSVTAIVERGL